MLRSSAHEEILRQVRGSKGYHLALYNAQSKSSSLPVIAFLRSLTLRRHSSSSDVRVSASVSSIPFRC